MVWTTHSPVSFLKLKKVSLVYLLIYFIFFFNGHEGQGYC